VGMSLSGRELLPEETSILGKNANALVRPDELLLSRLAFDHALGAGLRGTEAIGGTLHVTSYRLVFKSHAVNRAAGEFSIFLPTVREMRNTSSGLRRQLEVATATQRFTFVVWAVPADRGDRGGQSCARPGAGGAPGRAGRRPPGTTRRGPADSRADRSGQPGADPVHSPARGPRSGITR
jgi:hypothetical protein